MNSQKYSLALEVAVPGDGASGAGASGAGASFAKLSPGQTLSVTIKGKRRLDCGSGTLWVTVEGDPLDHILEPGMGIDIVRPGKLVVSALNRGTYTLA